MTAVPSCEGLRRTTWTCAGWVIFFCLFAAQTADAATNVVTVIEVENEVFIQRAGSQEWDKAYTGQLLKPRDRGRIGDKSRAALSLYDLSVVRLAPNTRFEIDPPPASGQKGRLSLLQGLLYFFNRDKPGEFNVRTPSASAAIRGTEFALSCDDQGRTVLTLLDGEVVLSNAEGQSIALASGEQGIVEPGKPPAKTAVIEAANVIQWCLYYPAVLDPDELSFTPQESQELRESLAAYTSGDLLRALASYPTNGEPGSASEKVFFASLLLAVGQVEAAEKLLAPLVGGDNQDERTVKLAGALRKLIAAVKQHPFSTHAAPPALATEWLAESYWLQSQARLDEALMAARNAAKMSPAFGFAWARVAELEFSFGRISSAQSALEKGLQLAPQNAQALALKGFLLAAQNRTSEAIIWFDKAIAADGALGNAWLGRGLCRIKQGRAQEGRADLLAAAALEPQRALLRSYLGKAFADSGDDQHATKELKLARELDPNDPTVWLYSALLKQQQNRINEAISDLEASQEHNDNRSLFRSRLLLDEDRAVRSANLASIYRDAGMTDVSVREATRAVTYDYANDSAHLFLADSYNELRDPTRFNLRYETVWFNELLLANLLSPVGGGRLSQHVSEQEYSRLFEANGFHFANSTLGRSDNKSVTELASQFGTFGSTSYSLDLDYDYQKGVRPNNDLSSIEWYSTVKQQITPQDTALALIKYEDYHSGDNFQYYDPSHPRKNFRFDEYQHPIAVGAWHHEWSPGMHTLLLGGRLENEQHFSDRAAPQLLLIQDPTGKTYASDSEPFDVEYRSKLEIYTVELNQIFQWNRLTLSTGGRYQSGTFATLVTLTNPPGLVPFLFPNAFDTTEKSADFERITGYGYLTVEPLDRIWLTGGVAYEDMTFPRNFRNPPISGGQDHRSELGPKAALVWEPLPQATVRGVFTRSLGGVSLDESYRLEPTQLAGFPQAFRSLISESVVGSVAAPEYETFGLALDLKFPTRTYAGLQAQRLETNVRRTIGLFTLNNGLAPFVTNSTLEKLDYRENSLGGSLNQLVGDNLVLGVSYKFDDVELNDVLPGVPVAALASARQNHRAELHEAGGYVLFNHPSGFFARADATWYHQNNFGYTPSLPGDDFVQENIYAGYRLWHRRAEIMVGILNLSGQDYHLNPLTVYQELPRERTFMARLKFQF